MEINEASPPVEGRGFLFQRKGSRFAGKAAFLASFIPAFGKAGYSEARNKTKILAYKQKLGNRKQALSGRKLFGFCQNRHQSNSDNQKKEKNIANGQIVGRVNCHFSPFLINITAKTKLVKAKILAYQQSLEKPQLASSARGLFAKSQIKKNKGNHQQGGSNLGGIQNFNNHFSNNSSILTDISKQSIADAKYLVNTKNNWEEGTKFGVIKIAANQAAEKLRKRPASDLSQGLVKNILIKQSLTRENFYVNGNN